MLSLGSPAGRFAAAQRLLLCRSSCQPTLRPPSASRGRTRVRWGVCSANVRAGLIFKPQARTVGLSPRPSPPPSRRGVALSWNQANGRSRRANSRLAGWMVWECPCGLNFEAPSSDAWAYPRQHAPARASTRQPATRTASLQRVATCPPPHSPPLPPRIAPAYASERQPATRSVSSLRAASRPPLVHSLPSHTPTIRVKLL